MKKKQGKSDSLWAQAHRLDTAELTLIRTGQHLFLEWRHKGRSNNDLQESFECIWRLKREIRAAKVELLAKIRQK